MTRTKSTIGVSAVVFVGSAMLTVACGSSSDSNNPGGSGGSSGVGGHAGSAGHGGVAGSSHTGGGAGIAGAAGSSVGGAGGAGAGGSSGAGGAPNNCTKLPANLLLTDFSANTIRGVPDGTSWKASKSDFWGNSTSLTGGDVFYQGKAASAPTVKLQGETLTITASVAPGDYAGYMFNFKPACTNASTTQGLKFDVLASSTLGNATFKVQMQQKSDYPSTANPSGRPGDCVPTSMETQYSDCLSPGTTVVSSGSPLTPGTVELPWTTFSGGAPVSNVDPGQLMAIQWQFECPSDGGIIVLNGVSGSGAGGSSGTGGVGGVAAGGAAGNDTGGVSGGGVGGDSSGAGGTSGGTSGAAGSGGTGGSSAGTGGTGGIFGVAGISGPGGGSAGSNTAGVGGTAGSAGTAGVGGTAGSGTAGSGGSGSTPQPCVVSIVIDNVTFY